MTSVNEQGWVLLRVVIHQLSTYRLYETFEKPDRFVHLTRYLLTFEVMKKFIVKL
jgi:hypothetical protein